jgi:stage II sporulation protein D
MCGSRPLERGSGYRFRREYPIDPAVNTTLSRREFVLLAAAGVTSACEVSAVRLPTARYVAPRQLTVRSAGRVAVVGLEAYTLAAALAEVFPLGETPAAVARIYEVQAVLARSYAASHLGRHRADGYDLCDSSHCQLYDPARIRVSRFAAQARAAVERTTGIILSFGQRPAEALFHADCGGYTAASDAIWGGAPVPYLRAQSHACRSANHRAWSFTIQREELRAVLNRDARSRVGAKLGGIDVRRRDVSGRAIEVVLAGDEPRSLRGEDLRAALNRQLGDKTIQSTRFSVRTAGTGYTFQGTGFGHGVGLCQIGAAAHARQGASMKEIFESYYKGAVLLKT